MWRRRRLALVFVASMAVGCRRGDTQRVLVRDDGVLCFGGVDGGPVEVRSGEPLEIAVLTHGCLDPRCATQPTARCSVKVDERRIVVTSEHGWVAKAALDTRCGGPACAPLSARCKTDVLASGRYEIVLGRTTLHLDVPSQRPAPCGGDPVAQAPAAPDASAALAPAPEDGGGVAADPAPAVVASAPDPSFCVTPFGTGAAVRAGQAVAVRMMKRNACVGASCSAGAGRCTLRRSGDVLKLEAVFPGPSDKPRTPCTEACPALFASCRSEPLPRGAYRVALGDQALRFNVPGVLSGCPD